MDDLPGLVVLHGQGPEMRKALEHLGFEVEEAYSWREAFVQAREFHADVLGLAFRSGSVEPLAATFKQGHDPPLIFVSAPVDLHLALRTSLPEAILVVDDSLSERRLAVAVGAELMRRRPGEGISLDDKWLDILQRIVDPS